MAHDELENKAAPGAPFYTPAQNPPAGAALDPGTAPTLYKPIRIRDVELHNRFVVSPMCTYSADDGHLTDWHLVHLGQFAVHGAGLICVEATAVEARGRLTPQDSGLWKDSQMAPLKRIVDLIHSQNTKASIQLAHGGRKSATLAPWIREATGKTLAPDDQGGWSNDVVGPSAIPFAHDHALPKELTVDEIKGITQRFVESAKRAIQVGFDVVEIHAAHGYLLNSFLSPISNKRTDDYGGSFENRTRFLREIIQAVRAAIPETTPLWVRISATEWMEWKEGEESWGLASSIRLAKLLPDLGVDVLDVSSGGNNDEQKIEISQTFQTELARQIRDAVRADGLKLLVTTVGFITDSEFARSLVDEKGVASADLIQVARKFLREPQWVLKTAYDLGVPVKWPNQYHRAPPAPNHKF